MTYKQRVLEKVKESIRFQQDRRTMINRITDPEYISSTNEEIRLTKVRRKIEALNAQHFIPKRFHTAEFNSIKLSIPNIINQIYNA